MLLHPMVYYPTTNGRSLAAIPRLMKALQTSDATGVAPRGVAAGREGDGATARNGRDGQGRLGEGHECVDWYFCKRELTA